MKHVFALMKKMQRVRRWYTLTAIEQALYYELIERCNQAGWNDWFMCSNVSLCTDLNVHEKTLIRARKRLVESQLISYQSGRNKRNRGIYSLSLDLTTGRRLPDCASEMDVWQEIPVLAGEPFDHLADGWADGLADGWTDGWTDGLAGPGTDINKTNTKTKTKKKNKKESVGICPEKEIRETFEIFRQAYPGCKRGADTEFDNFRRKHTDYAEVADLLMPALDRLRQWCSRRRAGGEFVPPYPHLVTWINQRRWETELETFTDQTDEDQPIVIL